MQVVLDELGHRFPHGPWLFQGLTRTLKPAEIYALTGPSGSGKSTLLSLLAGWVKPAAGRLERQGVYTIGWVFQNPHGVAKRSVIDHVMVPLLAQGNSIVNAKRKAEELLEAFNLGSVADQPFLSLSGGEGQRLMLARGIASKPDLFLVDEPTAQLDLGTRREVNQAIRALATEQTIVVVATHDEETRDACTQVIDLKHNQPAAPEGHTFTGQPKRNKPRRRGKRNILTRDES